MIKEEKNIDFYTTGRQPSEQEFSRISEWIRQDKLKRSGKKRTQQKTPASTNSAGYEITAEANSSQHPQ